MGAQYRFYVKFVGHNLEVLNRRHIFKRCLETIFQNAIRRNVYNLFLYEIWYF
jgi:hypothetical protein